MAVAGIILAGGLARRMGGGDKPLHLLAGKAILEHVIERVQPQVLQLALNANGDPARFAQWRLPVVPDLGPGQQGPLAGILAGMIWAREAGALAVLTVPGDTPFVPEDLVERLKGARDATDADIAVAKSGGRRHHAVALWSLGLAERLHEAIDSVGMRRVADFLEQQSTTVVDFPGDPIDPFFNVNAPDDLVEAERLVSKTGRSG